MLHDEEANGTRTQTALRMKIQINPTKNEMSEGAINDTRQRDGSFCTLFVSESIIELQLLFNFSVGTRFRFVFGHIGSCSNQKNKVKHLKQLAIT